MKKLIISLLVFLSCLVSSAGQEGRAVRVFYGLEWGYSAVVLNSYHYNYTDPEDGYRVDVNETAPNYHSNGMLYLRTGLEFARHFSASVNLGWQGIKQDTRIIPVFLRENYHFNGNRDSGALIFVSQGIGFHSDKKFLSILGQFGGGYRVALSHKNSMDLLLGLQLCTDAPKVPDKENGSYISEEFIRSSKASYGAINLSISISF